MKKTLLALLLSLLFVTTTFAATPAVKKALKASHHTGQETITGESICSATAIGPQALLTATHCELPDNALGIRGVDADVEIVGRLRDGLDHTVYLVQGVTFADYVDVDLSPLEISQDVFTFGNPGEWQDIYQRGYISGVLHDHSMAAALGQGKPDLILFDLQAFPGESGAGIFNSEGKLVAVLANNVPQESNGLQMSMAGAYPLGFKQADIDKARAFSTSAPPAEKK